MARFLAKRAQHLGKAKMRGRLYDLGRYPGMTSGEEGDWVQGDVFELHEAADTLAELDRYEGCDRTPCLFERRSGIAKLDNGTPLEAWYYEYQGTAREKRIASWPMEARAATV